MDIKLQFNWQITQGADSTAVDTVLFDLLEAVQTTGSLKSATNKVGVSYRFAWGLLHKWEQILGQPLVIMSRGQGTLLAAAGEKLMHANRQLQATYAPELANFATRLRGEILALAASQNIDGLNIFASHGLAISALRDVLNQHSDVKLDLHFHGSLESLRALLSDECHVAGFHIPEGQLGQAIKDDYLNYLSDQQHQLIYVIKRNQGLIISKGNPKHITGIRSLSQNDVTFINRQAESGTRLLLDQFLLEAKMSPADINGYQQEEFTHMAVAAMVASGAADVGFGIAPMADKFNLDFIPLVWEHYCLAVPHQLMNDPRVIEMLNLLQSDIFKEKLSGLRGYEFDRAGQLVSFDEIFN